MCCRKFFFSAAKIALKAEGGIGIIEAHSGLEVFAYHHLACHRGLLSAALQLLLMCITLNLLCVKVKRQCCTKFHNTGGHSFVRKYQNTQKSSEKNHAELRSVRSSFRAESKEWRAPYSEELGVRSEELMCRHSRRIKFMPRLKGELCLPKKGFGSSYAESFFL